MTINLSTPVKYISSIALTVLLTAGTMYAVSITALNQTAAPGDTVTSTWVNAVNTATVAAAGAGANCILISTIAECKSTLLANGAPSSLVFHHGTDHRTMVMPIINSAIVCNPNLNDISTTGFTAYPTLEGSETRFCY